MSVHDKPKNFFAALWELFGVDIKITCDECQTFVIPKVRLSGKFAKLYCSECDVLIIIIEKIVSY